MIILVYGNINLSVKVKLSLYKTLTGSSKFLPWDFDIFFGVSRELSMYLLMEFSASNMAGINFCICRNKIITFSMYVRVVLKYIAKIKQSKLSLEPK